MLRIMVYIQPLKLVSGSNLSSLSKALRDVSCNKSFASSRSAVNLYASEAVLLALQVNLF